MSVEKTDDIFHMLLEREARNFGEDAIPAGQTGGPSITPDASDLTPPSAGSPQAPQGPSVPGARPPRPVGGGSHGGGRPPFDGMGVPPMGYGVPFVYAYPANGTYYGNPKAKRPATKGKIIDPEDCETLGEQIRVIADDIRTYLVSGRYTQAAKFIRDWYGGVMDEEEDKLYPETREVLSNISKNNLVLLIEALIQYID